jgi:hypothetical protein
MIKQNSLSKVLSMPGNSLLLNLLSQPISVGSLYVDFQSTAEGWADEFALGTEQEADFWERLQKEWNDAGLESGY